MKKLLKSWLVGCLMLNLATTNVLADEVTQLPSLGGPPAIAYASLFLMLSPSILVVYSKDVSTNGSQGQTPDSKDPPPTVEGFLANEPTVAIQSIEKTEQGQIWTMERQSDKKTINLEIRSHQLPYLGNHTVGQVFSVDVLPAGTIFSQSDSMVMFVLSEQGRHTITNL